MPEISWDTFERYRQKGLDARRAGQWDSAKVYLLEASRAMLELSKSAQGEELRNARRETAQKLLESGFLKPTDRMVLYNTGSGLKYPEAYSTRFPRTASSEQDKLGGLITPR